MTVPVSSRRAGPFDCDGVETDFDFAFKVFSEADVGVVLTDSEGVETLLTLNSHYTVVLNGDQENNPGGTITTIGGSSPYDTGNSITMLGTLEYKQGTNITISGGFLPTVIMRALDYLCILIQQLKELTDRSLRLPVSASGASTELPVPEASTFIGWNALGTALVNYAGVASAAVSSAWAAVVGSATLAQGRLAMGFSAYFDTLIAAATASALRVLMLAKGPADYVLVNGYLDWSVSGNVLTVAVKTLAGNDPTAADPVYMAFRNAATATGSPVVRTLTAACSISINNTATLGTSNSTAFRLWAVLFDDAGTVRMGVINCQLATAIYPLAGFGIASSTQEADTADSAHVFYTDGAAVASKAYAVVGYATWETGLASAGVWSAGPTRQQVFGPDVPLPGRVIQTVRSETGAVATGTTLIPQDDTIPQQTEGDQYLSQSITPTSAANVLEVSVQANFSHSAATYNLIHALFRDAGADAIGSHRNYGAAAGAQANCYLSKRVLAAATASTSFKLRAGCNGAGTTTLNGSSGTRNFGGTYGSFLDVREIMA